MTGQGKSAPFVARRLARVQTIVRALAGEPLRAADIAGLLGCTVTSARRDMAELRRAGVVALVPAAAQGVSTSQARYRLTPDRACVDSFLDGIVRQAPVPLTASRRDPLVAALFGEPAARAREMA